MNPNYLLVTIRETEHPHLLKIDPVGNVEIIGAADLSAPVGTLFEFVPADRLGQEPAKQSK